jgi:cullin 3
MAEYLSLFLDYKIRTAKENENLEEPFENAMVLFKYMQDKDIFESYYKIHLSKRLLMTRSDDSIRDIERLFVAKLKLACGYNYTAKIEGLCPKLSYIYCRNV